METWFNSNDVSKFLLIFFFYSLSSCEKESIWRWTNQLHFFFFLQQLILITENKQKICGTFSLERSFANFSSKKKKKQTKL